jgi:hypothetical protein
MSPLETRRSGPEEWNNAIMRDCQRHAAEFIAGNPALAAYVEHLGGGGQTTAELVSAPASTLAAPTPDLIDRQVAESRQRFGFDILAAF